ncbi:MAG TPA: hypothetical protein VMZ49_01015 [Patescibacteria group bacterium]|nr:hypothetical protein [Patescibacteria group bacterium]
MPERRLTLLYSADIFTGSLLLFWVQPMLAKRVLPLPESAPPGTLIGKSICPMGRLYLREKWISRAARETDVKKVKMNGHPLCKS